MATNAGKVYAVSNAAVADADLDQTAFEALTFVEIGSVGSFPEYGSMANIAEYKTSQGTLKGKGAPQFGGGDLECARMAADAGQVLMRGYGDTDSEYAFKITHASGQVDYTRGIISGPMEPQGADEDFVTEKYTLGFNQKPVIVEA
jgi:hypothetical protein